MKNEIRIMTANIWGDYFGNPVEMREKDIEDTIRKYAPDVIGLQEITASWYSCDLLKNLGNEYEVVTGQSGNFTPLLYKKDTFDAVEVGFERYSETDDRSKGITWALLKRNSDGKRVAVCNTHLWWMQRGDEDEKLRMKNAEQLLERVSILKEKYNAPVFAFGDFNSKVTGSAIKYLSENKFMPAYNYADKFTNISSYHNDPILGDDGKYHGVKTENKITESIDYILSFGENVHINNYVIVEDQKILDSSDHSPVYLDAELC